MRPTIALMPGDRNGIGSEVIAKFLSHNGAAQKSVQILIVADPAVVMFGQGAAGSDVRFRKINAPEEIAKYNNCDEPLFLERCYCRSDEPVGTGRISGAAGAEVLDQLGFLLALAASERIQGIVFGPFNKPALRLGGMQSGDTIDYLSLIHI